MAKISVFVDCLNPKDHVDVDMIDYLEQTRDGRWEDLVNECRLIKDKEKRNEFKTKMPTATLSGQFSYRSDKDIVSHSEYISMDLDDVHNINSVRQILQKDKYVFACFVSTSGKGLRVMFKIDPTKHRESFRGVSKYLWENYGIVSDPNGSNVSKPYCVSFDPFLFINPDPVPVFKKYVKDKAHKPLQDFVHTDEDFTNVMKQISGRNVNICEDYSDWLKVGFALASKFGESGRDYFHELSRQSPKYNARSCDEQYKHCMTGRGENKVAISTFYYLAKINNISITSDRTRKIIRTTINGKRVGLKPDQIKNNLEKFEGITNADKIIGDVFDSNQEFSEEEESILHVLEMYVSNNYNLTINEITGFIENNGITVKENDMNTIFIAAKKIIPKLDFQLMIRLLKSSFVDTYNPFFKFLGSDGIAVTLPPIGMISTKEFQSPVIDRLSSSIINENPAYTAFFFRKWVVSIISAMHKVHSPLLHCLLGPQLTGKTEFYRRLLPDGLRPYYQESKLDKGKDDELLMCENILVMDDELSGKSKQDTIKLNGLTSSQYFSLRRPYGTHNEKVLRYAVLCGTSNYPRGVLADPTGNRRIIPTEVTNVDKDVYNSVNKKEVFLEAFRLYKEGFDWRINANDIPFLNQDSDRYEVVIKERELLEKFYFPGDDDLATTTDILVELELMTRQKLNMTTLGRELEHMGFRRKSVRESNYKGSKKWCICRTMDKKFYEREPDLPF